jgi:hypothetical protein
MEATFDAAKRAIASAPLLQHPVKYSAFHRELQAWNAGIRHFKYMLEVNKYTIFTDHKPLTYAPQLCGRIHE